MPWSFFQLSPPQRCKTSPPRTGSGEGLGIRGRYRPLKVILIWILLWSTRWFCCLLTFRCKLAFAFFVKVCWMPLALTVLLCGPGSRCVHGKGIRMALASRTHVTYSSQTLMSQMPFIKSAGHGSTDSNSINWRYTKWLLQMPFAFLPGSWLASFLVFTRR